MKITELRNIPSADQARANAKLQREHIDLQRIAKNLELLGLAFERGQREVCFVHPVPEALLSELRLKGYAISKPFESDYNEQSVRVSW